MKGLVYKDISIFFKGIDKKLVLMAAGVIVLLMVKTGIYAGLFASVMLAMTIGIQNTISFAYDEKVDWKKYQLAMPVDAISSVVSKYLSVICTTGVSLAGSLLLNFLSIAVFREFNSIILGVSAAVSIALPLLWTAINLPWIYWFGFRSAQFMRLVIVFPVFYFVKYFEDGDGFSAMASSILSYAVVVGIAVIVFFIISMIISMIGYNRKK